MKKNLIKDYSLIIFGIILVAISIEYFFAPNNIASGGVTGLAIIINNIIPQISISLLTLVVNIALFIISFILLGSSFGVRSVITSIMLSIIMWIIEAFFNPVAITNDLMMATIFGTIISAFGMAIVFECNSSTGGTDIVAKIFNKFFHLNIGTGLLIIDVIITIFAIGVFGVDKGLYAILSVIILGITVDRFIDGFNSSKEVIIMSSKFYKIGDYIINDLKRECTYLKAECAYTKNDMKIVYSIMNRNEFIRLKKFILENDSKAFISVRESYEVLGEGFKDID